MLINVIKRAISQIQEPKDNSTLAAGSQEIEP